MDDRSNAVWLVKSLKQLKDSSIIAYGLAAKLHASLNDTNNAEMVKHDTIEVTAALKKVKKAAHMVGVYSARFDLS